MRLLQATPLIAALLLVAADARAQSGGQKSAPPPLPQMSVEAPFVQMPVDQGRLEGGTYMSDFFGFSFSVKPGWVAVDAFTRKALLAQGRAEIEKGVSASRKAQLDAAVSRTHVLVNVSKHDPLIPTAEFNAALLCVAERIPTAIIKTGQDYITASLRTLNSTNAKVELTAPLRTEKLGGLPFTAADVRFEAGPKVVAQRYYVRLTKGYALCFIFAYVDDEDLKAFNEMLKTVRFK